MQYRIIHVQGDSMYPTYKNKDVLIAKKVNGLADVEIGDVVVCDVKKQIVIKRLKEIKDNKYIYITGDNHDYSYDSDDYGYVDFKTILYKVVE